MQRKENVNYYKVLTSKQQESVNYMFHSFGDRGSSSTESAVIGGLAHLTQFDGTDNYNAVTLSKQYYKETVGHSIPASEHSTVTSWGRENEFKFYDHFLETYKTYPIIACVMDSYDIYKAVKYVTQGAFLEKVESDEYPIFVIRPDSGNPEDVMKFIFRRLLDTAQHTHVDGLAYFNKYRVIWGDGITPAVIETLMKLCVTMGVHPDMLNFGSGGDLMQNVTRDTLGFAIKMSSITLADGTKRDVYKEPIDDKGKTSKRGEVKLWKRGTEYYSAVEPYEPTDELALREVYYNGKILIEESMSVIRERSKV